MDNKITHISKNICKTMEGDDYVTFKAVCSCGEDFQDLFFEVDKDGLISLSIYSDMDIPYKIGGNFLFTPLRNIWQRIKKASSILFLGKASFNNEFIFDGKEAIEEYIIALDAGLEKLKKVKQAHEQKILDGLSK